MEENKFLEVSYWVYKNKLNSDEFWSMVLSNEEIMMDMIKFNERMRNKIINKIKGDEKQ